MARHRVITARVRVDQRRKGRGALMAGGGKCAAWDCQIVTSLRRRRWASRFVHQYRRAESEVTRAE